MWEHCQDMEISLKTFFEIFFKLPFSKLTFSKLLIKKDIHGQRIKFKR